MDTFISHASKNAAQAIRVRETLEANGLTVWIDQAQIALGALLKNQLQTAIQDCRTLVLLWSKAAAKSRWVTAEILAAFHRQRFIVPCVLDDTPLPVFLAQALYLKVGRGKGDWMERLCKAVRESPNAANPLPPRMSSKTGELRQAINQIAGEQAAVTNALLVSDTATASANQRVANRKMADAEKRWPFEIMVLILGGYHLKNAYMVKHWAAMQAGRAPADPLLLDAEQRFFEALLVDPNEYSALNGVGSILILERELEAAEFFVLRAIALAKVAGINYGAADHDLKLIQSYK